MKYFLKEKEWLRGEGSFNSYLLRLDGKKCCLGFVGEQCNIPIEKLLQKRTPYSVCINSVSDIEWPSWFFDFGTPIESVCEMMRLNDDRDLTDYQRKEAIAKIFTQHGDEIIFTLGE